MACLVHLGCQHLLTYWQESRHVEAPEARAPRRPKLVRRRIPTTEALRATLSRRGSKDSIRRTCYCMFCQRFIGLECAKAAYIIRPRSSVHWWVWHDLSVAFGTTKAMKPSLYLILLVFVGIPIRRLYVANLTFALADFSTVFRERKSLRPC